MEETALLRETLGRVMRLRRISLGLTLREVAALAGVSVQYLSEVERGLKDASSEMVAAIAGALRLTLPEVLVLSAQLASAHEPAVPHTPAVPHAAHSVHGITHGAGGAGAYSGAGQATLALAA